MGKRRDARRGVNVARDFAVRPAHTAQHFTAQGGRTDGRNGYSRRHAVAGPAAGDGWHALAEEASDALGGDRSQVNRQLRAFGADRV